MLIEFFDTLRHSPAPQLGAPAVGDPDHHDTELREDHRCQDVCGGHVVFCDHNDLKNHGFTVTHSNMEEIVLLGPKGSVDVRVVNSYPSKV